MADEKFSFGKFLASFFQAVPWAKNIRFILGLALVVFVGFTIYRAYLMPKNKQVQNTQISVASGGTLNFTPTQKMEEKKRAWWLPHLFVEGYGFQEFLTGGTSRQGVGGRAGGRLEW